MNNYELKFLENGAIKFSVKNEAKTDILFDENNNNINMKKNTIFCRCGKSSKQPFCDNTHSKINFVSLNKTKKELVQVYDAKEGVLYFNRSICCGAASCVKEFPKIYLNASEDWIKAKEATKEELLASVKNCPSGALSYEINEKAVLETYEGMRLKVVKNGPLEVLGKVNFTTQKWPKNINKEKFALCRCGASLNKPFCDYAHASLKDDDYTF